MCFLTPRTGGVKITIFAIALKRDAQSSCPFKSSIMYVFGSDSHSSCAAAFIYLTLRDMNVFWPLSCSYLWYVHFYYQKCYSHVYCIIHCWLSSPIFYKHGWMPPCHFFFVAAQVHLLCSPIALYSHGSSQSFRNGLSAADSTFIYALRVCTFCSIGIFY